MGARHAQAYNLHSKVDIKGFYDVKKSLAKNLALQFKRRIYSTMDSVLDDPEVDAVSICSPNTSHFNALKLAIKSGKNILIEKPIVTTLKHCNIITNLLRKTDLKVMVGHTNRFFPCNLSLKSVLESGRIGDPKIINTFDYMPGRIEGQKMPSWIKMKKVSGGGVFMTDLIHTVDKISWFMDSHIKKVSSPMLSNFITNKNVEDAGIAVLWLENGSVATCVHGCPSPGTYDMSTKIIGTKGEISLKFAEELKVYKKKISTINYPHKGNLLAHFKVGFFAEIDEFVKSINENRVPKVSYKEGIRAVRVILALYESFKTKRPIVI